MLDSSSSVRDAAIELVGKYILTRRDLALEYLPKIAERVNVGRNFPPAFLDSALI